MTKSGVDEEIERLLKQADALKQLGQAEAELDKAVTAYRKSPSAANKEKYRKATDAVVETRQSARAGRTGHGVGGDATVADMVAQLDEEDGN